MRWRHHRDTLREGLLQAFSDAQRFRPEEQLPRAPGVPEARADYLPTPPPVRIAIRRRTDVLRGKEFAGSIWPEARYLMLGQRFEQPVDLVGTSTADRAVITMAIASACNRRPATGDRR
jgi:hypothetical protein